MGHEGQVRRPTKYLQFMPCGEESPQGFSPGETLSVIQFLHFPSFIQIFGRCILVGVP